MKRILRPLALLQFTLFFVSSSPSLAQEWIFGEKPSGTLKVVDLENASVSAVKNYGEGLVTLDKDNNWMPCLAANCRWIDGRTIEFKLRRGVTFHNGEKFDAEAVRINWEAYKSMERPSPLQFVNLPDDTELKVIDEYNVQLAFPEADGLAFVKISRFYQFAPTFLAKHKFDEMNWGYLTEPGPWGTGPFKFMEGSFTFGKGSDRIVLEAYENYWDPQYPRVQRVIFDNSLIGDREEAMRLCREEEGAVDIVSFIRPLDTLKVAESPFAKVIKSRDVTSFVGSFNQRKKGSKWRDIRLRKAINYAINREELWKYAARGNAYDLGAFIPTGGYGHNPNLTLYNYDTEKARSLLSEAGYPNGFEVKIITPEAWKLEAQIISKMLERVGLKVNLNVLTMPEWYRKYCIPLLDKPPEEQEWDLMLYTWQDYFGNTAATHLNFGYIERSDFRWIEYDQVYETMYDEMARTVSPEAQEEKVRQLMQYVYESAYSVFIYSPLNMYAVNKEVNFVPQKYGWLRLKETSLTDKHWSVRGESSRYEGGMNLAWDEIWPLPEGVE
jgi:peptide/nickel transport system substrate-binding protein